MKEHKRTSNYHKYLHRRVNDEFYKSDCQISDSKEQAQVQNKESPILQQISTNNHKGVY